MTTTIKFGFTEQSSAVVCSCQIESDTLTEEEIYEKTKALFEKGTQYSVQKTMMKKR